MIKNNKMTIMIFFQKGLPLTDIRLIEADNKNFKVKDMKAKDIMNRQGNELVGLN